MLKLALLRLLQFNENDWPRQAEKHTMPILFINFNIQNQCTQLQWKYTTKSVERKILLDLIQFERRGREIIMSLLLIVQKNIVNYIINKIIVINAALSRSRDATFQTLQILFQAPNSLRCSHMCECVQWHNYLYQIGDRCS